MAERVVRTKKGVKTRAASAKAKLRSPDQLIDESVAKARTAKEREILNLIDTATTWDYHRKLLDKQVKKAKAILLAHAEKNNWKAKAAETASVLISPSQSTTINPSKFTKLLIKMKKKKLYDVLMSVRVGDAKKYLGEDVVDEVAEVDKKEFGTVTLKKTT